MRVLKQEDAETIPTKFRDCIFKIMPSQQYGAKKEFMEKVEALSTDDGEAEAVEYYDSLRESMVKETEMNAARNQDMTNVTQYVLRYGHTIQLLHIKSSKYVTADVKRVAPAEKDCQYIGVDDSGSMTSWFTILPRYKMRGVGDEVEAEDDVVFELIKQEGSYLHCSKHPSTHLKPFMTSQSTVLYEASVGGLTGWKLSLYRPSNSSNLLTTRRAAANSRNATRGTLEAGMLVRMFHTEARSYVGTKKKPASLRPQAGETKIADTSPLRLFAKPEDSDIARWRPPASSVWIVETEDRKTGPACEFGQRYRLRHFASGKYLYKQTSKEGQKMPVALFNTSTVPKGYGYVMFQSTSNGDQNGKISLSTGCYMLALDSGENSSVKNYMSQVTGGSGPNDYRHDFEWVRQLSFC